MEREDKHPSFSRFLLEYIYLGLEVDEGICAVNFPRRKPDDMDVAAYKKRKYTQAELLARRAREGGPMHWICNFCWARGIRTEFEFYERAKDEDPILIIWVTERGLPMGYRIMQVMGLFMDVEKGGTAYSEAVAKEWGYEDWELPDGTVQVGGRLCRPAPGT